MKNQLLLFFISILPLFSAAQGTEQGSSTSKSGKSTNNQAIVIDTVLVNKNIRTNLQVVKDFVNALADEDLALDIILSEHVTIENPSDEMYDYLEASLQEMRINITSKNVKDFIYKNFKQLPRKEVSDIDPEDLKVDHMFFLYHKDRLIGAYYVESDKVASFTLVSKGNEKAHFVTY